MFWQQVLNGLSLGSVYALVALGFVILWKSAEVLNFAQGDFMMLGAFLSFTFIKLWGMPIWLSFILSILLVGLLGGLLEKIFMRPLLGEPIFAIAILTLGLSYIIQAIAGMIWGYITKKFPPYVSEEAIEFVGLVVAPIQLVIIITTICIVIIMAVFLKFFKVGIAMRAVGLNQLASIYLGVNVKKFLSLNWVIAGAIGSIAGIILAPLMFFDVHMGTIGLKAMPAAVLGGFTSFPGAIVGGFIIGIAENLAAGYFATGVKDIVPWIVLYIILIIRPAGIFGTTQVKRV
ncbi:branched-chain amino acid ABC transporter permease [Thermodesulfobacteriota bacterium]